MSNSFKCNYNRFGSAKKNVKHESRKTRRQKERELISSIFKGTDLDNIWFPKHHTETSNWWNWD